MKCAACHNETVLKKGEIDLRVAGKLYLARDVTYFECAVCGEKVLSEEVSQKLYERIKDKKFVEEAVNIPVLNGTYG